MAIDIVARAMAAQGGSGGTSDYSQLTNKPSINGQELNGNKTGADLGLQDSMESYNITKVKNYLYNINYNELDYDYANQYFEATNTAPVGGGCSSVRKGDLYGRNLDWFYDNMAEFVVNTPKTNDRYASISMCGALSELTNDFVESKQYTELYKVLPFYLLDGMNEKGLFCNVNVVPIEDNLFEETVPEVEEREKICVRMLPRYILDNFDNIDTAIDYIKDYVKIYAFAAAQSKGYEYHFMIGDANKTYVLEIRNNIIVTRAINYMTNFYLSDVTLNSDGTVYTPADVANNHSPMTDNGITKFGSGLERFNLIVNSYNSITDKTSMRGLLDNLLYTRTYPSCTLTGGVANPFWYTEYVGDINGTEYTVDTLPATFDTIVPYFDNLYVNRTRDDEEKTWQTVHSAVYDLKNKKMYIMVQEDGQELEYNFDYYYTAKEIDDVLNLDAKQVFVLNKGSAFNNLYLDINETYVNNDVKALLQEVYDFGLRNPNKQAVICMQVKNKSTVIEPIMMWTTKTLSANNNWLNTVWYDKISKIFRTKVGFNLTISNDVITQAQFMRSGQYSGDGEINIELTDNKDTSISSSSTDSKYASAKAVYDFVMSNSANPNNFAPAYDATLTYVIGAYTTHEGYLYKCTTAITTPEAWTAAHWTQTNMANVLGNIETILDDIIQGALDGDNKEY